MNDLFVTLKQTGEEKIAPLRLLRTHLRLSQHEFARRVGINQSSISQYESGYSFPHKSSLKKILEAFPKANPLFLIGQSEIMFNSDAEENKRMLEDFTWVKDMRELYIKNSSENTNEPELIRIDKHSTKVNSLQLQDMQKQLHFYEQRLQEKDIQINLLNRLVSANERQNEVLSRRNDELSALNEELTASNEALLKANQDLAQKNSELTEGKTVAKFKK